MSSSVPLSLVSFISYPKFQGMQMVTQLMRERKEGFGKMSVVPIFHNWKTKTRFPAQSSVQEVPPSLSMALIRLQYKGP